MLIRTPNHRQVESNHCLSACLSAVFRARLMLIKRNILKGRSIRPSVCLSARPTHLLFTLTLFKISKNLSDHMTDYCF